MPKVAVVGLGNVLIGDDAFGPYVVRLFEARYEAGSDVVALDLGTPGLDLAPHLEGLEALIVVDTVSSDGPPGTLELYGKDDLLSRPAPRPTDPHQPGVKETLLRLEMEDAAPSDVLLVGVVPGATETGVGMTPPVRKAAEAALEAVLGELERLGYRVSDRTPPGDPDIWWERRRTDRQSG
jgi:hydrogenase maturation protease